MDLAVKTRNLDALYVEDDPHVRNATLEVLSSFFRQVHVAENGQEGLRLFDANTIHLVICDIRMPKMSGLEMAAEIRKTDKNVPIFITTSHSEREELMAAIPLNIADYLIKPFTFGRLQAALKTCIERIEASGNLMVRLGEGVSYNPMTKELSTLEETFLMSGKERALLELLFRQRGRLVSREQIEGALYGDEFMSEAALKNLMHKLRKKLGKTAISNVHNTGFILRA